MRSLVGLSAFLMAGSKCRHCRWHKAIHLDTNCMTQAHSRLSGTHARWHSPWIHAHARWHSSVQQQIQSRIVTPLWPCLSHNGSNNEAFVSLMPAVLVQDRFVSTVYWGYTIIVSHVLVTLSVFSWIGDKQNLWFVSVTRRRDARDDTHHSFCVVTLDSAGHWTQPLALVRVYIVSLVRFKSMHEYYLSNQSVQ